MEKHYSLDQERDPLNDWLAPSWVSTPNLLEDVQKYCGVALTENEFASLPSDIQRKLRLVTERLEFIEHLLVLREFVRRCQRSVVSVEEETMPRSGHKYVRITENHSFVLWGHDLGGADFDMEAMIFYLLLTVIDTIKGSSVYKDPFEWLAKSDRLRELVNLQEEELREQLGELERQYRSEFGLRRKFVEAFVDDLPEKLRDQFVSCVVVVKVKNAKVDKESLKAWEERSEKRKLEKIAKYLYDARSSFTHSSVRTFFPAVALSSTDLSGEQLLCRPHPSCDLSNLLKESIRALIKLHFSL